MTRRVAQNIAADAIGGGAPTGARPPMTSAALLHRLDLPQRPTRTVLDRLAGLAVVPMARPSGLRGRLGPILDTATDRRSVPAWAIAIASAATVAIVPFLAAARLTRADPPPAIVPAATRPAAASPVTRPAVDAAALVREVRAAEAWIDSVRSFRVRFRDTWAAGKLPANPAFHAGVGTVDIGFDRHRMYTHTESTDPQPESKEQVETAAERSWDGHQAAAYERYRRAQPMSFIGGKWVTSNELYALEGDTPAGTAKWFLGDLTWGRAGPHKYWWRDPAEQTAERANETFGRPEDYRVTGRTEFRGDACLVLERDASMTKLYAGETDHRLHGIAQLTWPRSAEKAMLADCVRLAAEAGRTVKNRSEFEEWLGTLPADRQAAVRDGLERSWKSRFARPWVVQWYADYSEVAPKCWFPMRQGYDLCDAESADGGDLPTSRRTQEVVEIAIDQPLPEAWFTRDWKEGVPVNDWGHKPPLSYRYKKHFTPDEWQAVLDEGNARAAEEQARADKMNSAVGKRAAEFPGTWMQGKPVRLADLKGKVTVVAFWATWCGPCRNDVPSLNRFAEEVESTGIGVLSVHAAGTPADDVRKAIADEKIGYPVCIDSGKETWNGPVFGRARVVQLPSAMVIDRDGRIAAVGSLSEVWTAAARLAAEKPASRPTH